MKSEMNYEKYPKRWLASIQKQLKFSQILWKNQRKFVRSSQEWYWIIFMNYIIWSDWISVYFLTLHYITIASRKINTSWLQSNKKKNIKSAQWFLLSPKCHMIWIVKCHLDIIPSYNAYKFPIDFISIFCLFHVEFFSYNSE